MGTDDFMSQYEIDDSDSFITSPVGGPQPDQESLSAGERGPSLLEDQIVSSHCEKNSKIHTDGCHFASIVQKEDYVIWYDWPYKFLFPTN